MKKIFTLSLLSLFIISLSQAQTGQQFSLITKKTADWCPKCGSWGWSFSKNTLEQLEGENVIFWAMHKSGGLATETSMEVSDNFAGGGQPIFYLNQDDIGLTSSNGATKVTETVETIGFLNGYPSSINVDVIGELSGDELTATANVKFEEGTETDYNVSIFLLRDKLVANQASVGSSAEHSFILDEAFHSNVWGPIINDGNTLSPGDEFTFTETLSGISPHTSTISDMKVAAVVWYFVNDEYTFINGGIADVQLASSSNELAPFNFTYALQGNQLELTFDQLLTDEAQLQLFNLNGQQLAINDVIIQGSSISATLNPLSEGAYILKVKDGNQVGSRKIFVVE